MPTVDPRILFFERLLRQMRIPPAATVAGRFAKKYPRFISKVDLRVGETGPALGTTGIKHRQAGQSFRNYLRSPAQPVVTLSHRIHTPSGFAKNWSPEKVMTFAAGHELQHAREALGKSNASFIGRALLNKAFVPYGWRANEWRANTVGAQVAKLTPNELWQIRRQNLAMGAAGAGVRTAVGGGAYALYRRRRKT